MKKILVILLVLTLTVACANTSFLCRNKATIENTLNSIIIAANALILIVPQGSAIVAQAEAAIQVAQAALAKACPTDADVQLAQGQLTQAMQKAQMSGLRLKR